MNCLLKAINDKGELRDFSCDFMTLEIAFDFLNHVVSQGDTLLDVRLVDDEGYLVISVAAFDGESFETPFNELEKQWREILYKPVESSTIDGMTEIKKRWHSLQQKRHEDYAWMVENLKHQLHLMKMRTSSERMVVITKRYESMLSYYQQSLAKQKILLRNGQ